MPFKADKAILIVISVLLLGLGQYSIFVWEHYAAGFVLTTVAFAAALSVILGFFDKIKAAASVVFAKAVQVIKAGSEMASPAKIKPVVQEAVMKIKDGPQPDAPGKFINFSVSKNYFFILVGVIFLAAQFLLFKQKWPLVIGLLVFDIVLFVYLMLLKNPKVEIHIDLPGLRQGILLAAGIGCIIVGWMFLTKRAPNLQNTGVIWTTIGIFLAYFGLPKNKMSEEPPVENGEMMFAEIPLLKKYWVKIILIAAGVLLLNIGNRVAVNNEIGMYSMLFFAMAIFSFFLALPLINHKEPGEGNLAVKILKLAAIVTAVFIAYKGQKLFVVNQINSAITHYLFAAFLVIAAFPVSLKKTSEQEIPRWVEFAFVIAITLIGIFLRVYEIDKRPFGLENDEASALVQVLKNAWIGQHPIFAYVWEFTFAVFGEDRIGLRMSGALVGIVSVPVFYFAVRSFLGARTAIFAVVAFTFLRWNVHYGRSGHGAVFSPIAEAAALFFIFKALKFRDKFNYFMAGAGTGFCWTGLMTGWLVVLAPAAYFFIEIFTKKKYLRRNLIGLLAFAAGFWIFASVHVKNYFISDKIYFSRISEVSVFSKDPNAPVINPAKGIIDNTRRVMLMFNHHGDSRQRNSGGMPYEPSLDFMTAVFFGLGILYCAYYSQYSLYFILLMIFVSQAAGSIFSIEAPSAMRAVGTMVPALLFAAIIFNRLWGAVASIFKFKLKDLIILPVVLALFLVPIVKDNYGQVFKRWVGGMDELTTAAGMYSQKLGKDYRIFLYTSLYWTGHPPYRIFRWDYKVSATREALDCFRDMMLVDDENFAVFLHYDTWQTRFFWERFFPGAEWDTFTHEGFGKMLEVMKVKNEDIAAIRGLTCTVSGSGITGTKYNSLPVFDDKFADKIPYKARWEGSIYVPFYGKYTFFNRGSAKTSFYLNGLEAGGGREVMLNRGYNSIVVESERKSPEDRLKPAMTAVRYFGGNIIERQVIELTAKNLYSFKPFGITAEYLSGENWFSSPVNNGEILPIAFYNSRPRVESPAVRLSASYIAPIDGRYSFPVVTNGFYAVTGPGKKYWTNGTNALFTKEMENRGYSRSEFFDLKKGPSKLEFYTLNSSELHIKVSVNGAPAQEINHDSIIPDLR